MSTAVLDRAVYPAHLADVAFCIHPLTDTVIDDIVQQTRVSKLLPGVRGAFARIRVEPSLSPPAE